MRLWSLHPNYLDCYGMVALWREGLLAKKALSGKTKGYKNHPQLQRFKSFKNPSLAINSYLYFVLLEAKKRGYNFDIRKIDTTKIIKKQIPVKKGQVQFEFNHLLKKLKQRNKKYYSTIIEKKKKRIETNPLFYLINGGKEEWEKL
jgi:hypothetical protein